MTKYDGISTLIDLLNNEKINKVADWITYPKTVSKKWVDFIRSVSHSIKATYIPQQMNLLISFVLLQVLTLVSCVQNCKV